MKKKGDRVRKLGKEKKKICCKSRKERSSNFGGRIRGEIIFWRWMNRNIISRGRGRRHRVKKEEKVIMKDSMKRVRERREKRDNKI